MTFFLDACISPNFSAALKLFGEDVIHLTDLYRADTKDSEWIPRVCRDGLVVITADQAQIKTRGKTHVECALYQKYRGRAFFLPNGFSTWPIRKQLACFFRAWPAIAEQAAKMQLGVFYDVLENGSLKQKHARKVNV
ncbi:MAG: DUF5615 family PIN-like protein [Candidatus Aquilonibacter sp.]